MSCTCVPSSGLALSGLGWQITGNVAMSPSRPANVGDVAKEARVGSILGRHVLGTNAGILIDGVIYLLEGAPPIGKTKVGDSIARRRTSRSRMSGPCRGLLRVLGLWICDRRSEQ
jgi:hypothetical protein